MVASASPANVAGVSIKWWSLQNKLSARSSENERARLFLTEPKKLSVVVVVVTVAVLQRCQWGRSFVTLTHRCVCLSLPVCVCDGMQATICRALQNDLPTPKRSAQTFTNTRTRSLTYTHAHIRKQPECTGKNCGKLHEITKQRSHWAFRSHILSPLLLLLLLLLFLLLACCFRRQSAAQLFLCRFFSIALTFGSVLGKSFAVFSSPRFYIPIQQRHTRSLFCFVAAAATTSCPQITPHPPSSRDKTLTTTATAQYHRLLYTALVPKSFYFSITFCFLFACSRCKPWNYFHTVLIAPKYEHISLIWYAYAAIGSRIH